MDGEEREMSIFHRRVGDMSFQGGQTLHSVGMIEGEGIFLDQLPGIVIRRVYNPDGPSPHDDKFDRVRTPKVLETADGGEDLGGGAEIF